MTITESPATASTGRPRYSIVAPVFNEEALVEEFVRRVTAVLAGLGEPWELVLVNDGCRDRSGEIMRRLQAADPHVKVVEFARNFGHQLAITAGLDYAEGDAVVILDSDLQDPPEVIPELIQKWQQGFEVVYAVRAEREGETWFKESTAKIFYRLIHRITDVNIPRDTGDFRLLDRKAVLTLRGMRERHRFMRGMSVWVGFRQTGVPYARAARKAGETKYPFTKMLKFALDAITSFSYVPLQLATYLGFVCAALSLIGIIAVIFLRETTNWILEGQATTLVAVLFLGGVQLICLGILGEYLGRIYDEVKARPLYVVREALGFERLPAPPERAGVSAYRQ